MPQQHPKGYDVNDINRAIKAISRDIQNEVREDTERIAGNWYYANQNPTNLYELHMVLNQSVMACLSYLFLGGYVEFNEQEATEALSEEGLEVVGEDIEEGA